MPPRKPSANELQLIRENSALKTAIICLRRDLENKNAYVERLKYLLHTRLARTDELFNLLEQANGKLRDRGEVMAVR